MSQVQVNGHVDRICSAIWMSERSCSPRSLEGGSPFTYASTLYQTLHLSAWTGPENSVTGVESCSATLVQTADNSALEL